MSPWPIYRGTGVPHDGIDQLPPPPNWRRFGGGPPMVPPDVDGQTEAIVERRLGLGYSHPVPGSHELQMINAALFLRRPLLVTGRPGSGKSTLATSVATELGLGPVLTWPITSRSTLREGLYRYDPIGRLREENLRQLRTRTTGSDQDGEPSAPPDDVGRHLRLGPLGTALLPYTRPRVLLIDEIDKSDIELPNDLLTLFEDGTYEIDELTRLPADQADVEVMTADSDGHAVVHRGRVLCHAFPFVVLTSNGEREFPAAFLRRCIRLDLQPPDGTQLAAIIAAQLGSDAVAEAEPYIDDFLAKREASEIATDQLLNAVYLAMSGRHDKLPDVVAAVLKPLSGTGAE